MVKCELCGKEVKTNQALKGHKTWVHGITSNTQQPAAQLATEQRLGKLEQLLGITGEYTEQQVSDADGLDKWGLIPSKPKPAAEQVTDLTDKLNELTKQVDKQLKELADQLELVRAAQALSGKQEAELDAISRKLNLSQSEWKEVHNKLVAVVNSNGETARQWYSELKSRLEKVETQQRVHTHDGLSMMPQLTSRVTKQEQDIAELKNGLAYAKKLAIRIPTDGTERLKLDNGRYHTFTIYKSKRGLTRPHVVATDLVLGRKYVDLAEPED